MVGGVDWVPWRSPKSFRRQETNPYAPSREDADSVKASGYGQQQKQEEQQAMNQSQKVVKG